MTKKSCTRKRGNYCLVLKDNVLLDGLIKFKDNFLLGRLMKNEDNFSKNELSRNSKSPVQGQTSTPFTVVMSIVIYYL